MDYSRVPEELKQLNQWVCTWNNSKIPMRAFEKRSASSTDPQSWSSFEEAAYAVEQGYYDNLGFVFNDNGIVGIDIDAGFEDGLLTELGADIIGSCESYTEKSRSGRGVHILIRGDIPFYGKNNLESVEIYKSRRFFIVTGMQMLYPEIIENQKAIDYVLAKYFIEQTREEHNRPLVEKIYKPIYKKPENGKLTIRPEYPEIGSGGRNLSLTSLAGSMYNTGYTGKQIYEELLHVNSVACKPPLPIREIQSIVESITRYKR